jgi:ABC-type dipeptide/oligopeptide/nickel transport system ATPase component
MSNPLVTVDVREDIRAGRQPCSGIMAAVAALKEGESLVILDEPVSALDVSIRAQVLNLLADIQEKLGLTYFIIAHDLATLGHVSKRIGITYLGRVVEMGDTDEVFSNPLHPYTRALLIRQEFQNRGDCPIQGLSYSLHPCHYLDLQSIEKSNPIPGRQNLLQEGIRLRGDR